jgi:mannan endo-1,4-beta-mannosidase
MNLRKTTVFIAFVILFAAGVGAAPAFVEVKGKQFIIGEKPYYYIGTNYWYGSLLGLEKDKKRGLKRLRRELDFLKKNGVNNLRVMAGAEGSGLINGVERVGPPLQPEQGKFNPEVLRGLDILLDEMSRRGLKAVVFFSNNWEWSGGFQQYLDWNGLVPQDQKTRKLNWDEHRDIVSRFYACKPCHKAYNQQVELVLSRTNTVNNKKYTEDPTIMAWELANEPRPMRPRANDEYKKWIAETVAFIKARDKNHLVTTGVEGEIGTESLEIFEEIHRPADVDYLTIHIWAKNWSWFEGDKIAEGFPTVIKNATGYIEKHIAVAEKLGKPLVIEEFGLPRDGHSFDLKAATTFRDRYFETIFERLAESAGKDGALAGLNFWAFGGTARLAEGRHFFKPGDDYTGDPPMEEQGLNSVFAGDKSTWRLIRKYSAKLE